MLEFRGGPSHLLLTLNPEPSGFLGTLFVLLFFEKLVFGSFLAVRGAL